VGSERVVMLGWQNGNPNGVEVYDPLNEDVALVKDFEFAAEGDSIETRVKLADLGLVLGQTIALSAFQEGASDGWAVDWMASTVLTLAEGGSGGMTLETLFSGNPVGFEILVTDQGADQVDPATVVIRSGGQIVNADVTKTGGVTTITGRHPTILAAGTLQTVALSLKAGGKTQSKDFVLKVDPYSVLTTAGRLIALNKANPGFVVNATLIGSLQSEVVSVHSNLTALAEDQLAGRLTNGLTSAPFYNEAEQDASKWVITPFVADQVINWFELAPGTDASLNFTNDEAIPHLSILGVPLEGVVVEILTYLELAEGYHKIGLYTEGGHKISAGLKPTDPLLSVFDNDGGVERVPTYYARNQFVDLVAPEAGFYPIRVLWFQSKRNQEPGLMLELFSVKDRELHLLNRGSDPKSIRAYRAGALIGGSGTPTLSTERQGTNLRVQWTGMLQVADALNGSWNDYADQSQSPMTVPMTETAQFMRSRSY